MILAVERGTDVHLFAYDLQPKPSSIEPPIAFGDDPAQLTALLFAQSLSELGLSAGALDPAPMPNQRIDELDFETFVAAIHDGAVYDWSGTPKPSQAILDFNVPLLGEECPSFDQILLRRADKSLGNFLISLDDGGALAGFDDLVVRYDADAQEVATATVVDVYSAAHAGSSVFVLSTETLYRAIFDPLRMETVGPIPLELEYPNWVDGGPGDQLFSLSRTSVFSFYDGSSWHRIDGLPLDGHAIGKGGALWLGPGQGAALNPDDGKIARWDGSLHFDIVTAEALGFGAGVASSRFGALAVDNVFGYVFRFGDGLWEDAGFRGLPRTVQALTDYRNGLAWGSQFGVVGYATVQKDCGEEPVLEASEVIEIARLGDGLIVGYVDRNNDYLLIYFRPRQK